MTGTQKTWLASYLYYAGPWEEFLTKSVKPFVDSVFEKKLAEQFFFIRCWERGPHVRLRFKGEKEVLETQVKPMLEDRFSNYFKQRPSQREKPGGMEELPPGQQWFPNNSVQYNEYEPEIERYGGPAAILIAEKQFEASSRAVLAIIEECEEWNYDRALGAAVQLHLGFAHALGMDLEETTGFYSRISKLWFSGAYGYTPDTPAEEIKKRRRVTRKAFEENFNQQKDALIRYHRTLWHAFTGNVEFEQDWLNRWLGRMAVIKEELAAVQQREGLVIHKWFEPEPAEKVPPHRQQLWAVLESYVHMTNNRLGILNRDEAYLGYLIKESLKQI